MEESQEQLSASQRADLYRTYAEQAIVSARQGVTEEIRQGYLKMAKDWLELAGSIEAHYGKVSPSMGVPAAGPVQRAS